MPNIANKIIFKEFTRTPEEQRLYDLEAKTQAQSRELEELKSLVAKLSKGKKTPAK